MTFSEEFEHIKAAIYDNPRSDPGRLETCLSIALGTLENLADSESVPTRAHARSALRRMEMRVRLGDDQPAGADITYPEWEPGEPRYMETLDADERGGW